MLALSLSDKFYCFGIFVFVFNRFLFFHHCFVLVLVFVNEFVIFSYFAIFVFVFVNENHTGSSRLVVDDMCVLGQYTSSALIGLVECS